MDFPSSGIMKIALGAIIIMSSALGCIGDCDPLDIMESGDYVIIPRSSGNVQAGYEWLVGQQLHVDRDAKFATIRYTRNGTTYEVRYTLEEW